MAYSEYLPDVDILGIGTIVMWFIIMFFVLVLLGIGLFLFLRYLKFNKKIVILEDVAGSDDLEPVGKDKAMLLKVAKSGMEVLYLRKRKTYKGAYGKRMGKNTYYFAIGPDGYWYNVTLGSLTKGMQTVGIKPTPVNMRYQNEALQEIIKERYEKVNFWQKYGGTIALVALIAIFGIMAYLLIGKFAEIGSTAVQVIDATKEVQDTTKQILGSLDKICSTGGYTEVGG